MTEISGDLFSFHRLGPISITTNGSVRRDGACVMGRGVALQAKRLWPNLPFEVGHRIKSFGNTVQYIDGHLIGHHTGIFTFPVKHHWSDAADLTLIEQSAVCLKKQPSKSWPYIYLPRPGCGNGHRDWLTEVKPILLRVFGNDPRFVIVNK